MERYEKRGYWWLPSNPEKQVPGTLVFGSDVNSELQLLGTLQGEIDALNIMGNWGVEYRPEIILGLSSDGKEYTLFNCLQTGCNLNSNAFVVQSFLPLIVIEGRHFPSLDEIVFQQMSVRLAHLGEWYQRTGRKLTSENVDVATRKIALTYQKPDNVTISYDGGRIEFGHDTKIKYVRFRGDFVISEEACFSIFPESPLPMLEFLDESLPPILNFFNLGIGRATSILELRGKAALDCIGKTVDEVLRAPAVKLYWKRHQSKDENKELFSHDMVVTCPDFGDELEGYLTTWTRAYKKIKPVMQLFFGRVFPESSISANSFINAVQTIEAYHRFRRDGQELSDSDHQKRLSSVLDAVNDEHRKWLSEKLQYSNEKGLRKRLKELLKEWQVLFEISNRDIQKLANRATELRNFFTHYSGDKSPDFGSGQELYIFEGLFKWVMIACLLEEMGIPRERVYALLKRNQAFLYFRSVQLKKQQVELIKMASVNAEEVPRIENE